MTTQETKKVPKNSSTQGKKRAEESTFGMNLGKNSNQPLPVWRPPTPTREDVALQFSPERRWFRSLFSKEDSSDAKMDSELEQRLDVESGTGTALEEALVDNTLLLHDETLSPSSGMERLTATEKKKLSRIRRMRTGVEGRILSKLYFDDYSLQKNVDDDNNHEDYIMMKTQHGKENKRNRNRNFDEDRVQEKCGFFYTDIHEMESKRRQKSCSKEALHDCPLSSRSTDEYFLNRSRLSFLEAHNALNSTIPPTQDCNSDSEDDDIDLTTLFSFGCSPETREREGKLSNGRGQVLPAIADIRMSSLSYIQNGRIKIRVPKDNVRLVMDPIMEPGIICVERNAMPSLSTQQTDASTNSVQSCKGSSIGHYDNVDDEEGAALWGVSKEEESRQDRKATGGSQSLVSNQTINELTYTLTVDDDLYKRIISEIDRSRLPCGLYYCCNDADDKSEHVNIGVAIIGLTMIFLALAALTIIWPYD